MTIPTPPYILFRDDFSGDELLFDAPREIITADTPDSYEAALDKAEAARQAGKWLAGYFSYEAGYLLEPKLRPLLPEGRRVPLAVLGIFDGPSETKLPADRVPATNGPIFGVKRNLVVRGLSKTLRPGAPASARG